MMSEALNSADRKLTYALMMVCIWSLLIQHTEILSEKLKYKIK